MYRNFVKPLGLIVSLAIAVFFTSCQKDDTATGVDNFVLQSTIGIEEGAGVGMTGCYELVFPVTIQFSDSSTVEVTDYKSLRQAIRDWFVANGGRPKPVNRPRLVFPFQVINQAGEIITVETPEQLKELLLLCKPILIGHGGGHHGGGPDSIRPDSLHGGGHHGGPGGPGNPGGPCFTLVFPVTVSFPDGTQVTVNSPMELGVATFTWNSNNPGQHARPELVFPFTVTLRDGTQVVVTTKEELQAIKDGCRG